MMCIEVPDGTSHVDCNEDLNLADNAETSAEAIPSVNGCGLTQEAVTLGEEGIYTLGLLH